MHGRTLQGRADSYTILIKCSAPKDFGEHFVPLALYFEKKKGDKVERDAWEQNFVLRLLSLRVLGR